ncbi:ABC transporter ATP-binding protein [Ellagibacter isourolithinifaciens]|uniref:ABC transporter ATP-binding protein n=1 Tax=Ellagibacter isourolithinifaciens TaxID=2137581 RepID=UPI002E792660|nr:ABC transporter ATP-binding protein [Ellagibacter isourolithinifaciens]MEE0246262.1 ABC transporter ATP-binding protein [Ellagibacter isourolithinifaciens]
MWRRIQDAFALTDQGMKDFMRGAGFCALANLMLMLPIVVLYFVASDFIGCLGDPAVGLPGMAPYVVGIVAALAVMLVTQMWEYRATYTVVYEESARKRIAIAERLRLLPLSFLGKRDLADLTSVIMKDCSDQERLFSHTMPQIFGMGASTLVFAAMMFAFDWRLAASALWPIPVALVALLLTARVQKSHTAKKNAASLSFVDGLQEYLECHREIRSLNKVGAFQSDLGRRIDRFEREKIGAELAMGVAVCSAQGFLRLGIASVIVVGTMLLVTGRVDFLVFFVYLLAVTRVYDPINVILQAVAELMDMSLSLKRMRAIENEPIQTGSTSFEPQGYDVAFDDVGFAYADGEDVLDGVSFTAREGQVTALVGASGSGKSTAVKLASRFWDVSSGAVFVGGVDVSTVDPETLLSSFSEVFQDVVLFDDSVRENIRLGKKNATDEEVLAAARAARCDEFVERLPNGYDTLIGENGGRLSGGERQRISIARALLKNAPIVLLDEATASLDVENETQVQAALSELLQGKTVLVIAHRMRTVDNADKIVVLEGGRVVEQGSPAELREKPEGRYRRMLELQSESAAWAL